METRTLSLCDQGIQALREGRLDQAVEILGRAVTANRYDAEAQAFLGVACSQQGLHVEARQALEAAVELQPRSAAHHYNLGVVRERAGDRQGAIQAYRETRRLDPVHAQARARLAVLEPLAPPAQAGPLPPIRPMSSPLPPTPRTLSDAPQVVKSIRWLYGLGIFTSALGLIAALAGMASEQGGSSLEPSPAALAIMVGALMALNVWLLLAVPKGNRAAYYVQMILSGLGLLGFPLGTLLHGYILSQWVKPETKAWFGV